MQTLNISITPKLSQPVLYLSQNDIGRTFVINLKDFDISSGATAVIHATKPSEFGFSVSADSITGNAISFTTTAVMTDEYGRFPAEVHIESGSVKLGTANFIIEVEKNPHPEGTTDGQSGSVVPTLTLLVERAEAAANSVRTLSVSAETLAYSADATATYDSTNNSLTLGIPRGGEMICTDPNADGNVVITFR